jgi:hypothetical protein
VPLHVVRFDLANRDASSVICAACAHQLRGDGFIANHNDVGEKNGERLIAEQRARDTDSVSETERLRLLDEFEIDEMTERIELGLHFVEVALAEKAFEFGIRSEIGLKQSAVFANDQDDGFDATCGGFLDRILDERFARDRQHFLRQNLRGREHAGAVTRGRDDCLCDFLASGQARPPV